MPYDKHIPDEELAKHVREIEEELESLQRMQQTQPTIHRVENPENGGPTVVWTNCPECGKGVAIDEDGCCIGCGRDAIWLGHCPDLTNADDRIRELDGLMGELTSEDGLIKRMVKLLLKLEFSHGSRYGDNCPICGGLEHGGVDSEPGPDRGHEAGCEFRKLLDDMGAIDA